MSVDERERGAVTTSGLLAEARRLLTGQPRVLGAFLLAGVVVAAVDALRRGDPVPTGGFVGLLDGDISLTFGLVARVTPHAPTPLSALPGLRVPWLVWTAGLELLRTGAVIGAGVYGFARLLDLTPSVGAVTRYAAVFGAIALASAEVTAGLLLGLPLVVLFLALLVRLLAFPAYLVGGRSITGALRRSWASTAGHAWPLAGVVVLVGFANHALSSLPLVGPVGSALAAALQVGVVAAFVRRVR